VARFRGRGARTPGRLLALPALLAVPAAPAPPAFFIRRSVAPSRAAKRFCRQAGTNFSATPLLQ
jgi:hypothetical protein